MTRITVRLRSAVARLRHEANKRAIYAHTHTRENEKTRRPNEEEKEETRRMQEMIIFFYVLWCAGANKR